MKYSSEIVKEIANYIRAGNSQHDSAILAGINPDTFYSWLKDKSDFSDSIKKAEQVCKSRNIAFIQKAAEITWQAAAWWLERKYKDEFALKNIQEYGTKDGKPLPIGVIMYGQQDPLFNYISSQFQPGGFKPASPNGHARQAPISSSQLASESKEDDTGDKSVDKMGE